MSQENLRRHLALLNSIFVKLGLMPAPDERRRVLAVLAYPNS